MLCINFELILNKFRFFRIISEVAPNAMYNVCCLAHSACFVGDPAELVCIVAKCMHVNTSRTCFDICISTSERYVLNSLADLDKLKRHLLHEKIIIYFKFN